MRKDRIIIDSKQEKRDILPIILAAGEGVRMASVVPKVLQKLCGRSLLEYSLKLCADLSSLKHYSVCSPIVVVNNALAADPSIDILRKRYCFVEVTQEKKIGTGDAVLCAMETYGLTASSDNLLVLILYADVPMIKADTIQKMIDLINNTDCQRVHECIKDTALICLAFESEGTNYGRLLLDRCNFVTSILEKNQIVATEQDVLSSLCNAGPLLVKYGVLRDFVTNIVAKKRTVLTAGEEIYLTHLIGYVTSIGMVSSYILTNENEALGINNAKQLARAEQVLQNQLRSHWMSKGVIMHSPETVFLSIDTVLHRGVYIYPYVWLGSGVEIGANTQIFSFSHIENALVGPDSKIGPFVRIREDSIIKSGGKIGNFVELKSARLENAVKVGHLSYIGNADLGDNINVGAGVVFCNYDGKRKHTSRVSKGAFIGSNVSIISPIDIGEGSVIAAGSVITEDVPAKCLAIGRIRQVNKLDKSSKKAVIIAIDGPAASGKSVVARRLAEYFHFKHLSSGTIYRVIAYLAGLHGVDTCDVEALMALAKTLNIAVIESYQKFGVLETEEISRRSSVIAAISALRDVLIELQRSFAYNQSGLVIDGRDIGTVIFKRATCKLYITADLAVRAERRFLQSQSGFSAPSNRDTALYANILKDLKDRDERDISRSTAPLKPAADAIIIDTTEMNEEEVTAAAISKCRAKISGLGNTEVPCAV